jgi:N-acetyldiaminopimelate deacetylase
VYTADALVQIRRRLHQIPEPGFQEFRTQALLLEYIGQLPQERLQIQTWETGILVFVKGKHPRCTIGYRADMDGLPIVEETTYEFPSTHSGYMHACGHDLHMTIGLGVLAYFAEREIDDNVLIIFQPAEEGPGGALPMLTSGILDAFKPKCILALHIAPEYPVGTIATKPGILFANTSELFIDFVGQGGHAAFPHQANDMVVAAAHFVTQVQSIIARNVDPLDSAVITIGKIVGGTKQNIIAGHARLEGTIRTLSNDTMEKVKSRIEDMLHGIEVAFQCQTGVDYGANYHQVYNEPDLTAEFMEWVASAQPAALVTAKTAMTGEDFGYFLADIPGFMFWLGVDTPYGLHHAKIEPDENALSVGVRVVTEYIRWKSEQGSRK